VISSENISARLSLADEVEKINYGKASLTALVLRQSRGS